MELFFEVNNQKMERIDIEEPVNSSQEYLKLSFDFKTDDWEDTTRFVFFRVHHINYSYPLTDDSIFVPAVFLNSKHLDFGVYGVGGEDYRITTNSLRIKFRESKFWSLSDAPLSVTELIEKLFNEKADLTYVDIELADKVDKVDGKELSSNDFTDEYLNLIETHQENINDLFVNKVDKVEGKGLSSNDFTDYYKEFLDGFDGNIEAFLLEHKAEIEALISQDVVDSKADKTYVDTELDKKANTEHTHTESDITDLQDYALEEDVYSKSEVDEIIHNLQNNIKVNSTNKIIQLDETTELYAYCKEDGMPTINKKVHFYQITEEEPTVEEPTEEETITSNDD